MTANEIRASFLEFFARHDHRVVPSSSLVPAGDPTLLFTNAGMNQFKDVFLGREQREYRRATSSQKCMRVGGKHNDLENVGPSFRHHTFFEMLGNFSFGDYFKSDAIPLAWTLLTRDWQIPADRLYATVFSGDAQVPRDDEAYDLWRKFVPATRVEELGAADNFWAMGDTGPCGRCSEIHYFRGDHIPCHHPVCLGVACDCDRFVEIWNNVFMEFDRQPDGRLDPLPAPSIDTGMGLERITALLEGVTSNYDTDLFTPLVRAIADRAGTRYEGSMAPDDVSMRVVADHLRAMTFLIADGVVPSNEWRGYVLRKIMRRAMRHGKRLRMTEPFLSDLVAVLAAEMEQAYPQVRRSQRSIEQMIHGEEERFESVLTSGLPRLEEVLDRAAAGNRVVDGDEAFRLYDTFGLPLDFIEDLAGERRLTLDTKGFDLAMEAQRERARSQSAFGAAASGGPVFADETSDVLREAGDRFDGYSTTRIEAVRVLAVFDESGRIAGRLTKGHAGYIALERTPFYAESGGQVSDTGWVFASTGGVRATVERLVRPRVNWPRLHQVRVDEGVVSTGDLVTGEVDAAARNSTRRNHTATHLLHAALRRVLGGHVRQAGSLVAPDRLRFDFVHGSPVGRDEIEAIERMVNERVRSNLPVETEVRLTSDAIAAGATALFGEKYGDHVRVVSIPEFSVELCGGTHCERTGDIGLFTVTQETGIAAGVRRIEAATGAGAVEWVLERRRAAEAILAALNVPRDQALEVIGRLQTDSKRLARENSQLKMRVAMTEVKIPDPHRASGPPAGSRDEVASGNETILASPIVRRIDGLDKSGLRSMADALKDRLGSGVVVLSSAADGRASLVVSVSRDLTDKVHAGNLVKQIAPIVGGGGGGRPDFAEAGGKNPEKIDEMLTEVRRILKELLRS